jgi:serine O-acetyltransferase
MFELVREDWRTHERDIWRQGFWTLLIYRFGRWRYRLPGLVRKPFSLVYKLLKFTGQVMTGIDLPCETMVGRRLRIEHFGGIIVSGDTVIGDDVVIRNGVTLGLRRTGERGAPILGNRVDIGAGAKLLGKIHIGDGAVIGANSVVLQDVPAGALAVGIPARIILRAPTPPEAAAAPPAAAF